MKQTALEREFHKLSLMCQKNYNFEICLVLANLAVMPHIMYVLPLFLEGQYVAYLNPNLPDPLNFVPFGTMRYSPFDQARIQGGGPACPGPPPSSAKKKKKEGRKGKERKEKEKGKEKERHKETKMS